MLCWNILGSHHIFSGTESSSKTHYDLLRLLDCCIKIPWISSRDWGIETPRLFLWLSSTGINLSDIIARQFLDCSLALNFFRFFSSFSSFISFPLTLSFSASLIHSYAQSLPLSLWFYLHIYNFFWCLLYSKRHFLVRFFSWRSWHSLQPFIQTQDIVLLTNGELFSYILAAPFFAPCLDNHSHPKNLHFLTLLPTSFTFFSISLRHSSMSNLCLYTSRFISFSRNAPAL